MEAFGAVLLAGGASRRMGRDKALLPLPDGRLLWQRQLAVLQALEPAELFISGPAKEGYPPGIRRLEDACSGLGPLGGIATALNALQAPRMVVLAVDLPMMTERFLQKLLDQSGPGKGCVPRHAGGGFWEPLAAVYPRACAELALTQLRGGGLAMQSFVRAAGRLLQPHDIAPEEEPLFVNWNGPVECCGRRPL